MNNSDLYSNQQDAYRFPTGTQISRQACFLHLGGYIPSTKKIVFPSALKLSLEREFQNLMFRPNFTVS